MKANAPEKIYIHVRANKELGTTWHGKKITNSDIEYIRKDAFIEKACDFFEENIEEEDCKIGSSELVELRSHYESLDSFIRVFRNYMKW